MSTWTDDELAAVGDAEELEIAAVDVDGQLGKPTTIWVVPADDRLFVRSMHGLRGKWHQGLLVRREGHIWAGGVSRDVSFADVDDEVYAAIDAAYRNKYHDASAAILDQMTGADARASTLEITARGHHGQPRY